VIAIVPDPESQGWKDLNLYDKYRHYPWNQDPKLFREFLHHHSVSSIEQASQDNGRRQDMVESGGK